MHFIVPAFITFLALKLYFDLRRKQDGSGFQRFSAMKTGPLVKYEPGELEFSSEEISSMLGRHSAFFRLLNEEEQSKFTRRCKRFIARKYFFIHSSEGYKEMPLLATAAAIQLTFGLEKFLFPHYYKIHIYPEEFLRTHPNINFLQGNVSGSTIRLSWKHLLHGILDNGDGQNVALHEMAHALHYQTFVMEKNVDRKFREWFSSFDEDGNKVYQEEKEATTGLYSKYAMQNFQEFWAESVEIFFEKPLQMRDKYPELYLVMCQVLRQDMAARMIM